MVAAIGTTFVLLIFLSAISEVLRLQIIAHKTRDAVQAAVTETCESNYAGIYDGKAIAEDISLKVTNGFKTYPPVTFTGALTTSLARSSRVIHV